MIENNTCVYLEYDFIGMELRIWQFSLPSKKSAKIGQAEDNKNWINNIAIHTKIFNKKECSSMIFRKIGSPPTSYIITYYCSARNEAG